MGKRISRRVERLERDQAIYYGGPHGGQPPEIVTH
jgi:hypothetical protein